MELHRGRHSSSPFFLFVGFCVFVGGGQKGIAIGSCHQLGTGFAARIGIAAAESIVFSNAVYGWIKAGQRTGFDERYFSVDFGRTDHAAVASAFGVKAWKVEDPGALEGVLRQAVDHGGPTLVDIISQPLNEAAAPVSEWIA